MIITLVMKKGARRDYNLTQPNDIAEFKKIITRVINEKNVARLTEAKKQLVNITDNPVAAIQLIRIQEVLSSQNTSHMIRPQIIELPQLHERGVEQAFPPVGQITLVDIAQNMTAPQLLSGALNDGRPAQDLITDVHFFPRSEYHTRFYGTTAFDMQEAKYWDTYHRSESSRFFTIAGSRKKAQFSSPCTKKGEKDHSFHAHTGGFHSPFVLGEYDEAFKLEKHVDEGIINVRDQLLLYKIRMAKTVVENFEKLTTNKQKVRLKNKRTQFTFRPIVFAENDSPCVLVAFPVLNPVEIKTEAVKYWAGKPEAFQSLLLCSFIAFLNVEAMREKIPIEMVLRASFGHNLPSVCESNKTFRINVGLIPKCYAELIAKALHQLNQAVNKITDEQTSKVTFHDGFLTQVKRYNAKKLKKAISKKTLYRELVSTDDFNGAEASDEAFNRLYASFCMKNNQTPGRAGKAIFKPVNLENKTIWETIRQTGDSRGGSVLTECFREQGTKDWFANRVMEALLVGFPNPIEMALSELLKCITYGEKATMNYAKIRDDLRAPKKAFHSPSFEPLYQHDPVFSEIVSIVFDGFCAKRPSKSLYEEIEHAGTSFFKVAKGSQDVTEEPDYGSDSEFEDEVCHEKTTKKSSFSHHKLRVCSGMKAILLAQYGALSYFHDQGITSYKQDIEHMYYEVEDALRSVNVSLTVLNKIRATVEGTLKSVNVSLTVLNKIRAAVEDTLKLINVSQLTPNFIGGAVEKALKSGDVSLPARNKISSAVEDALKCINFSQPALNNVRAAGNFGILHFDLNHSNATNSPDNQSLEEKLAEFNPSVAILDYTSSTTSSVKKALQACFSKENVKLVILVDSGLKNNQGGCDINPYGEVRICARDRRTCKMISAMMQSGLSEQDKLTPRTHEKVRACKRRGMAFSLFGLFKTDKSRFQVVEEERDSASVLSLP
jgi:hypothetical protein